MRFDLKVRVPDIQGEVVVLGCPPTEMSRCRITYNRHMSPTIYYINPPVVY